MYEIEEKKREKLISMGNSSTLTDDEIEKKKNKGNCIINFPFSPALPSCSIFDIIPPQSDDHQKSSSSFAGYIDLLSTNDFTVTSSSTLLDWFPNPAFDADDTSAPAAQINQLPLPSPAVSDVLNTNPATPISVSSSISSSSNEACVANKPVVPVAGNEHELELLEEDQDGEEEAEDKDEDHAITITHVENQNQDQTVQTKKLLKPRKKKSRKERAARVSFKTKSDVDHLDDGYRWRKYGQKPVKNSPYPRSYYRCTTAGCGVKKRLERSAIEPSFVLTSYEGQHTHFSPILSRAAELGFVTNASSFHEKNYQHRNTVGSGVLGNQFPMASQSQPQHFQQFQNQNQNVLHQQNQQQAESSSLFNNYNNSYNIAPPLNVVNSVYNFMDRSTSFGGFLQNQENYGGSSSESSCLRINLGDLVSDVGLLQDMIAPKEMAGAGAGAGEGRIDGDVNFMLG